MQNKWLCLLIISSITSACNLYGGLDSPSGDDQKLVAARACLDQGDYPCAREKYAALSTSQNDVAVSETSFTNMAAQNIFSIQDLVASLGSNHGDQTTFINLTQLMAANGKTDVASTAFLQTQYTANAAIVDPSLRSFMQFLVSTAMFAQILSSAVGADGVLTASDLVDAGNLTQCRNASNLLCTGCTSSAGTLNNTVATEPTSISVAANWNTAPTLSKLVIAASAAANTLSTLAPNSSLNGILQKMSVINSALAQAGQVPGGAAVIQRCERQAILTTLFP